MLPSTIIHPNRELSIGVTEMPASRESFVPPVDNPGTLFRQSRYELDDARFIGQMFTRLHLGSLNPLALRWVRSYRRSKTWCNSRYPNNVISSSRARYINTKSQRAL